MAARMLRNGVKSAKSRGISLRSIAKSLGYKQATVLSHMASGRVAIPIKRAQQIAITLNLDPGEFVAAVVGQHSAATSDLLHQSTASQSDEFATDLVAIADHPLSELTEEQRSVMREVVSDPNARRRWLSLAELPVVLDLRRMRPAMREKGLNDYDRNRLRDALKDD